jgi:streptolysin S family bacteriocin protoxin
VSIHNSSTFIKDVEINSITTSCCCFCCCFAVVSVDDDNNDDDGDALLQPILITI